MAGLLSVLVVAGATLVGLVILGVIFLLGVRLLRPGAAPVAGGDADEAELMQEIHRSLVRLEDRVERLESRLFDPGAGGGGHS